MLRVAAVASWNQPVRNQPQLSVAGLRLIMTGDNQRTMYITSSEDLLVVIVEGEGQPIQLEFEHDQALLILDQLITEINLLAHRQKQRSNNLILFKKDGEIGRE